MRWRDRTVQEAEQRLDQRLAEEADNYWLKRAQRTARVGSALAGLGFGFAVLALAIALFGGCATVKAPDGTDVIVLPERSGGAVATALSRAQGGDVSSITPPGLPPIVFRNSDDRCMLAHEAEHARQKREHPRGEAAWGADWAGQFVGCLATRPSRARARECYLAISWEREALAAQDACVQGLASVLEKAP